MNDDTILLGLWYSLMAEGSFAATFFAFMVAAESSETRRVVRWYPKDHQ